MSRIECCALFAAAVMQKAKNRALAFVGSTVIIDKLID